MLRSNSKSLGNYVVSPEEEEKLQSEGFTEKEDFKCGKKDDGKLIIISKGRGHDFVLPNIKCYFNKRHFIAPSHFCCV